MEANEQTEKPPLGEREGREACGEKVETKPEWKPGKARLDEAGNPPALGVESPVLRPGEDVHNMPMYCFSRRGPYLLPIASRPGGVVWTRLVLPTSF